MRLTVEDIGRLVRPRVLTHVFLFSKEQGVDVDNWWRSMRTYRFLSSVRKDQIVKVYKKSVDRVFDGLVVGNTATDPQNSYTAQITHLLVRIGSNYYLFDSVTKGIQFQESYQKKFGTRSRLKVCAVGVKFFGGFTSTEEGTNLLPIKPFRPEDNGDKVWFYEPKHVIPLESVVRFESVEVGDLVMFQKSRGVAVTIRQLNKPKFFKTCSWSSRTIWLLNGLGNGHIRFLPDRQFTVVRVQPE